MRRLAATPRPDWVARVEAIGLTYHSHDQGPYWDESACYAFTLPEILRIETATRELHRLCIDAAEKVIVEARWKDLNIPEKSIPSIVASWERDDFSLYGRFDLAYSPRSGDLKLLEYNADTPTALVEAAVVQWYWLQECHPGRDQFNSLHERLVEAWRRAGARRVHFTGVNELPEDEQTLLYLQDTLMQAGGEPVMLDIREVGWHRQEKRFVDRQGSAIEHCFKLYPWEWLWAEPFAAHLPSSTHWLEPAWKMLLSNKGLLPLLWEMAPEHPLLLPSFFEPTPLGGNFIRKPVLSREGANVSWVRDGIVTLETAGGYADQPCVYQGIADLGCHEGFTPVLGSWVVDHEPAGLGIREDVSPITGNLSRFVPHFIE